MENKIIESDYAKVWMDEDGICHIRVAPGAEITLDAMKEIVSTRDEVSGGKQTLVLVDMREVKSWPREAREYIAGEEG